MKRQMRPGVLFVGLLVAVLLSAVPCLAVELSDEERDSKVLELLVRSKAYCDEGNFEYAETLCDAALFLESMHPVANALKREILANRNPDTRRQTFRHVQWFDDDLPMRRFEEFRDRATGQLAPYEPIFLQR